MTSSSTENRSGSGPIDPEPPVTAVQRFFLALAVSPRAFSGILRTVDWAIPLGVVVLFQLGASILLQDLVVQRWEEQASQQIERNTRLTPEQQEEALQGIREGPARKMVGVTSLAMSVFGAPVASLLAAVVLLLIVNFGLAGNVRFGLLWPVTCLAWAPHAIRAVLFTLLARARGSYEVFFGPAALLPDNGGLLRSLLSVFDLFDIWMLAIHVVGLGVVAGLTRPRARTAVVVLWVAYWVVGMALAYLGHRVQQGAG